MNETSAKITSDTLLEVMAQFGDRSEAQNTLGQLRFDRPVRIKGIGHAIDDARLSTEIGTGSL